MTATRSGPLSDVRVIEAGTLIAGPFCGQLLADFGAEVIKVEDPGAGDPMRQWGQVKHEGKSLSWPVIARNKKSVTANLRTAEGQRILRELVAGADVFVENFRPGTLERWGLSYDELQEINPRLVLVRVTGYGQDGPYASRAGFGAIGEAMGGMRHVTGEPDRPPSRVGVSVGDSLAATFSALGAVMALHARNRTGRGQVVDTAIYEAVLAFMESMLPEWEIAGYQRERTGSVLPRIAPSNAYPTADGAEIIIGANRDTVFARLCELMGEPELATGERYGTHDARGENQVELDELIAAWTRGFDAADVLDKLHEAGVPAGRVYTAADMTADPHFAARQAIVRLMHPELGEFPMQNVVPRLSDTPGEVRSLGPELGEHNAEIYGQLLGADEEQLARWRSDNVI
ncbi:CaiB/BaiF CoA transferase family protein [Saccharopolyspora endophytica]|uniref:CoA transferase n=1 Tax=Saccharopolyspora endophytica TaxID=543886 RepID=A0ABS5DE49_9PSEU|nr:CoA transferase [Saccharopolyspora endophytica]MBQ0924559.1 CoA transferase [Saccharopolyspora endophytica]